MQHRIGLALALTLGFLAGFVIGAEIRGREFGAELQRFCDDTLDEMPESVPQRLFINVTDEWNRTLERETRLTVEARLDAALGVFSFSDRLLPRFEGVGKAEVEDDDHVLRLVVVFGRSLQLVGPVGWHCSNHIFVSGLSDPSFTSVLVHELGHFFGLYHEWRDATYMGYRSCWGTHAERFNEEQTIILDEWKTPGTKYTPHWGRKLAGDCPLHFQLFYGIPVVLTASIAVAITAVVLVIRRQRRQD